MRPQQNMAHPRDHANCGHRTERSVYRERAHDGGCDERPECEFSKHGLTFASSSRTSDTRIDRCRCTSSRAALNRWRLALGDVASLALSHRTCRR